jgi:hypothetical protein
MATFIMSLAGLGLPLLQSRRVNDKEMKIAQDNHNESVRLHIELARRDILNEMRDQNSNKMESLLIMNTLMIGCCFAVVIEGMPPRDTYRPLLSLFAFSLSSSICMFLLSVWFIRKTQARMSRYNLMKPNHIYIVCGNSHSNYHSYFMCHCYTLWRLSVIAYYIGIVLLMMTAIILFWARFMIRSRIPEAAFIFAGLMTMLCCTTYALEWRCPTGAHLTEHDYATLPVGVVSSSSAATNYGFDKNDNIHNDDENVVYGHDMSTISSSSYVPPHPPRQTQQQEEQLYRKPRLSAAVTTAVMTGRHQTATTSTQFTEP